jgi:putative hemolysin
MNLQLCAIALAVATSGLLSACNAGPVNSISNEDTGAAADFCKQKGGVVETRYPFYGTNNSNPLQLAGSMHVCVFTAKADHSRILVALDTLYTDQPTLASIAYRATPTLEPGKTGANPSSIYCTQLGGTDAFGGVNASGGGWAKEGAGDVISMCVFPDLSSIDSWGLTYHSDGTIRGADLTDLFRYQGGKP